MRSNDSGGWDSFVGRLPRTPPSRSVHPLGGQPLLARCRASLPPDASHLASLQAIDRSAVRDHSVPRAQASAGQLLTWWRGHWRVENQLHWVGDVVFGEDACRIQSGGAPQNMAAFRNAGIRFLRFLGCTQIAKTLRQHACQVDLLLAKRHPQTLRSPAVRPRAISFFKLHRLCGCLV